MFNSLMLHRETKISPGLNCITTAFLGDRTNQSNGYGYDRKTDETKHPPYPVSTNRATT